MYRYFLRSPCTLHFLRLQNLGKPRGPPCTSSPRVGLEVQKVENKSPQCAVLSCLSPLIRSVGWHHAVDMALESLESQVPGNSFCVLGGPDALLLHAWKHWKRQKCILLSISVSFRTDSFSDRFSDRNLKIGRCPKNRTVWQHWIWGVMHRSCQLFYHHLNHAFLRCSLYTSKIMTTLVSRIVKISEGAV